jgi:hypothetical protein
MRSIVVVAIDDYYGQKELIRLVQGVDDLVTADRDGALAFGTTLGYVAKGIERLLMIS